MHGVPYEKTLRKTFANVESACHDAALLLGGFWDMGEAIHGGAGGRKNRRKLEVG